MTIQSYSSHLYSQLYDLTPSYSQIESSIESSLHSIPFVGAHCTPTPPPPPTPVSLIESLMLRGDAVTGSRTRTSIVAGISVVGITYAVLSRSALVPTRLRRRGIRSPKIVNGSRQEAIGEFYRTQTEAMSLTRKSSRSWGRHTFGSVYLPPSLSTRIHRPSKCIG
jgi:hypothetical protein